MKIFKTFKPKHPVIKKYISYYYLDVCDSEDYFNEYTCYPHINTTLSFYKSNIFEQNNNHSTAIYRENTPYLKVITPIRESILKVTQIGKVHKVAAVFEPLGINQFLANQKIVEKIPSIFNVFNPDIDEHLSEVFNTFDDHKIVTTLDAFFLTRLSIFHNKHLEKALHFFLDIDNIQTINEIAVNNLGISRKHLNHLFISYLNITPQKYRMIVRFRYLMNARMQISDDVNFTKLAYYANYADQSHFVKACRQLTGLTPKDFFDSLKAIGSEDIFWSFIK
ncbi:helix-turn-helix domain-containing protein [Pedobacter terrae]|uniref:helix-turn-helix domain-containing protein n=1 Tax=Pedobacter terrae TaxID=405671 RepID=UPI002FFB6AAE